MREIATGLGIKKVEDFKKQDLVYAILDEQAIQGASKKDYSEPDIPMQPKKRGRPKKNRDNQQASAPQQESQPQFQSEPEPEQQPEPQAQQQPQPDQQPKQQRQKGKPGRPKKQRDNNQEHPAQQDNIEPTPESASEEIPVTDDDNQQQEPATD
ncbi:MAG: Rho termination factor N-terminal domain-containing protein, partial [Bacteroidales bacterium]|nr:Rho termination factor N-terminal domain-containing protein [Bacteroidales bacterium]